METKSANCKFHWPSLNILHESSFKKNLFTSILALFLSINFNINCNAQTTTIIPNTDEGSAFIGPFGNAARQLQFIIDDSMLTSLVGKNLTSISFRLPASTTTSWPTNDLTMNSFNVYLSDSVEPADRQLDFTANIVGTQTQVRSGSLNIPAGALTIGSDPNDFSFKITFNSAWEYNGGNLLIEVRHSGTGISSRSVHAASTSSAGYGTLYSALWQSTGNVLQGNFIYVEITADGQLGTSTVTIGEKTSIFPNPVKDVLFLKSRKELASYMIYGMTGQLLISGKIAGKENINVGLLPAGQYLLN